MGIKAASPTSSSSSSDNTENNGFALATNFPDTGTYGLKITIKSDNCKIKSITKISTNNATIGYILDAAKNIVAQENFSGNVATFASPYAVTNGLSYYFVADSGGASHNVKYSNVTFPVSGTNLNWIKGYDGADNATQAFIIASCVITKTTVSSSPGKFIKRIGGL